jgi:phosphoglucomutase
MTLSALAGQPAPASALIDVAELTRAYYEPPDPSLPEQRIAFGTSGHRGSSLARSFNEAHVLAISQAICSYRQEHRIDGPLFLGIDTHALSAPAFETALEVLAASGIDVMIAGANEPYTPTPAVSRAILAYNRGRTTRLADGIVITPSHNPPRGRRLQIQSADRRTGGRGNHTAHRNLRQRPSRKGCVEHPQTSVRESARG